jgi:pseudouridine kinase
VFDIIVIGGTNVDIKAKTTQPHIAATSNPGVVSVTPGGVARNISHNLALLGLRVGLMSAVGRDAQGEMAMAATKSAGVDLSPILRSNAPTGCYVAVLDSAGELVTAVNDMRILEELTPEFARQHVAELEHARFIVADCNIRPDLLDWLALRFGEKLIVEPVSVPKSAKLRTLLEKHEVFLATPNRDQLAVLMEGGTDLHECGLQNLVVHLGADGAVVSSGRRTTQIPSMMKSPVSDVTGAGDSAVAGLAYGLFKGYDMVKSARFGQAAASLKLNSTTSAAVGLSEAALHTLVKDLNA